MTLPKAEPLAMHRGDTFKRALLNVQWPDGTAITWGLTPKAFFTVKRKRTDPDGKAIVRCTSNPADGLVITTAENKVELEIVPSKTLGVTEDFEGEYDVQVIDSAGRVGTVKYGSFEIRFDTTHATS